MNLFSVLPYVRCILICAGLTLCGFGQSQLTIEKAKERLEELNFNYRTTEDVFQQRIEREVAQQVSTLAKGEFETSKEFQTRLAKSDLLRKSLVSRYMVEKDNRKAHFLTLITQLEDAEFQKSARVTFGMYNADTESLPITVFVDGESHDEVLSVPRSDARELKEKSSEAEAQALFGVATLNGNVIDYFFAVTIQFRGQLYSSLPQITPATQGELDRLYKDPFVLHLRRVFSDYLRGSLKGIAEAFFEGEPLNGIDKDYFRSKFIVGFVSPSPGGGKNIAIIFKDRPDVVFWAWVYKVAGEKGPAYELRGFSARETDPGKVRVMKLVAKKYDPKLNAL